MNIFHEILFGKYKLNLFSVSLGVLLTKFPSTSSFSHKILLSEFTSNILSPCLSWKFFLANLYQRIISFCRKTFQLAYINILSFCKFALTSFSTELLLASFIQHSNSIFSLFLLESFQKACIDILSDMFALTALLCVSAIKIFSKLF